MITGIKNIIAVIFSFTFLFLGADVEARHVGQWHQEQAFLAAHDVLTASSSIAAFDDHCTIKKSKDDSDPSGLRDGLYKLLQLTKRRWNRVISYCDELINPAVSEKISDSGDYVASSPSYVIDVAFLDKGNALTDSLSFLIPHSLAIG